MKLMLMHLDETCFRRVVRERATIEKKFRMFIGNVL
jgi:hypothetical protein